MRDIRDPKLVGLRLEDLRELNDLHGEPNTPLSVLYDLNGADVADYQGSTLGEITAQEYLHELQSRTDRYAASTLAAIQEGRKPDDPREGE